MEINGYADESRLHRRYLTHLLAFAFWPPRVSGCRCWPSGSTITLIAGHGAACQRLDEIIAQVN